MANHMQKNLGHTLSRVSTLSTGKDRFQDVYRHKARYRFWDWYRFFKENANCSFLKKRERRPLALCSICVCKSIKRLFHLLVSSVLYHCVSIRVSI